MSADDRRCDGSQRPESAQVNKRRMSNFDWRDCRCSVFHDAALSSFYRFSAKLQSRATSIGRPQAIFRTLLSLRCTFTYLCIGRPMHAIYVLFCVVVMIKILSKVRIFEVSMYFCRQRPPDAYVISTIIMPFWSSGVNLMGNWGGATTLLLVQNLIV